MNQSIRVPFAEPEKLCTAREVATLYNIPYWKLRRFLKLGHVPVYRIGNSRALFRVSEFEAALRRTAEQGGAA